MTWTVAIPNWQPPSLNEWDGRHWRLKHRAKAATLQIVSAYCRLAGVEPATGKRRVTLTIVLGPKQRGNDPDNYWKAMLDALKRCGAIVDDSKNWIETPPVRFRRGKQMATELLIEDIDDGTGQRQNRAA